MRTTSLVTLAQRFFGNNIRNARKRGRTMKLLRSLLALAVLGVGTPVYANGPVIIYPENIKGIGVTAVGGVRNTYLSLTTSIKDLPGGKISTLSTCSAGTAITIVRTDPNHNIMLALFHSAMLTDQALNIWVQCQSTTGATGITVEMFHD